MAFYTVERVVSVLVELAQPPSFLLVLVLTVDDGC